jgi:hypothetical protein
MSYDCVENHKLRPRPPKISDYVQSIVQSTTVVLVLILKCSTTTTTGTSHLTYPRTNVRTYIRMCDRIRSTGSRGNEVCMYLASHAHAMRARNFLPEYVLIYYRMHIKVLAHVHKHTKTTRTIISTLLAGVLLHTSTNTSTTISSNA